MSGAAIVFQQGGEDHPHEVSDEVNTVTWPRPLPSLAE